jgi:luciferase family oxidoreductase group 1
MPDRRPALSVLDGGVMTARETSGDTLRATTEVARFADRRGFHRFWVTEHHNMATVATTTPPVMMAHLAALTERIRVGSGGIMLPNHPPLVVAEQIATLEALHPGRIDLGIGRAPGTDGRTAAALRRSADPLGPDDFPRDLLELMALLGDVRIEQGLYEHFFATPVATSTPQVVLLGSSGYSAQLAGLLGLPFAFAHHFDTGGTRQALDLYRESFRPSRALDEPYALLTVNLCVAETDEEADYMVRPSQVMMLGMRSGRFERMLTPEEAAAHPQAGMARNQPSNRIVGSPATAVAALDALVDEMGAQEVLVGVAAYGPAARITSLSLLADEWGLPHPDPADPADPATHARPVTPTTA